MKSLTKPVFLSNSHSPTAFTDVSMSTLHHTDYLVLFIRTSIYFQGSPFVTLGAECTIYTPVNVNGQPFSVPATRENVSLNLNQVHKILDRCQLYNGEKLWMCFYPTSLSAHSPAGVLFFCLHSVHFTVTVEFNSVTMSNSAWKNRLKMFSETLHCSNVTLVVNNEGSQESWKAQRLFLWLSDHTATRVFSWIVPTVCRGYYQFKRGSCQFKTLELTPHGRIID